ncbi:nuclear pore complex protein Nup133-like [Corticium candelabrum]|uniref:nuclear pore complex protein Nup133-like n=1 Tax=Corticium candelabrum TaxID=121492 RepID=UPI002E270B53|nr:nuclear pore complex protein Nup133-like [Corticium candelabrum]
MSADLVDVSFVGSSVSISASSPNGLIYFIANASHTNQIQTSAQLLLRDGQQITMISVGKRSTFYASTSDGAVFVIRCQTRGQQLKLDCQQLVQPQGRLAGLGRKFSSLLFGGSSVEQQGNGAVLSLTSILGSDCELLYVLTDRTIELWEISDSSDKLVCQNAVNAVVQDGIRLMCGTSLTNITSLYPLSIVALNDGTFLLAAYMEQSHISYLTIELSDSLTAQVAVTAHCRTKLTESELSALPSSALLSYQLVGLSDDEFVSYNQSTVWCRKDSSQLLDRLQVGVSDAILAAGVCGDQFVLLSQAHGMLTVVDKLQPDLNVTIDRRLVQPLSASKRKKSVESSFSFNEQLRSLFVLHCQSEDNMENCLMLANTLLASLPVDVVSSELDQAVFNLSLQLINDLPTSDPRWAEQKAADLVMSSSVVILDSLQSKLQAHSILVQFLSDMGFIGRLGTVSADGRMLPTVFVLCEHQEKLLAALALRKHHTLYPLVIDSAIRRSVHLHSSILQSGLTAVDVFYKDVSSIQTIVRAMVVEEESLLSPDLSHDESLEIVQSVNSTLQSMFSSIMQHRQAQSHTLGVDVLSDQVVAHINADCYYWTDTDGNNGIRTSLLKQLSIVFDKADTLPNGVRLLKSVTGLIDTFLNIFTSQLDMHRTLHIPDAATEEIQQRFSQCRNTVIKPFVKHGLHETATVLAEKYQDFAILVKLCETSGDEGKLQLYGEQFKNDGFVPFLFKYYMDQGQLGKLLRQPLSRHSELTEFLRPHTRLSWIHHLQTRNFDEAHCALADLADSESEDVFRKKTLLSLSKLSLLSSDKSNEEQEPELERLNSELDVILHQEQLADDVLKAGHVDPDKQPPLTVEDLIEFYTSPDLNPSASEYDFKKALDLVTCVADEDIDIDQLSLRIWCRAILRNSWSEMEGVEPVASLRETLFFRIVKLAVNEGIDLNDFVPDLDTLLSCDELEASGPTDNRHFLYLMKMGYEQLDLSRSLPV